MKSAYEVLGVPANAPHADIEQAYERARAHYSRERIAQDDEARDRWSDVQAAWQLLRNPETRAALDRKIAAPASAPRPWQPPNVVVVREESSVGRMLLAGTVALLLVFAAGGYWSWQNQVQRERMAHEQLLAELERKAEEVARQAKLEQAQAEKERQARRDEQADRRAANSALSGAAYSAARSTAVENSIIDARRSVVMQQQSLQAQADYRAEAEARRRADEDRQRVRNLCMQNYGRPVC